MRSLQAKMFLIFALIATLPLLAMSYLALAETRQAIAVEVGSANQNAAGAAAGFVDVYVENGRVLLESESRAPGLRDAAAERDEAGILLAVQGLYERSVYEDAHLYRRIAFLDLEGTFLAAHPAGSEAAMGGLLHEAAFAIARAEGRLASVPPPREGEPVLPLAVPVFVQGEQRGVLMADLGLAELGDLLRAFGPQEGQVVFLSDGQGRLLSHPNASVLEARPDWSTLAPIARARSADAGWIEYVDPATGERMLGSFATIDRLGWIVVNGLPTQQAYAALTRLSAVLIVLSGILAGAILLTSVVLARRIVAPVREITKAARELAGGRLSRRIDARSDDEIGDLASAFNDMARRVEESLDGLRRSEARYRGLVESTNDLIFTVQNTGELAFVGPQARRVLGERAAPGTPVAQFVLESDRLLFLESVQRVLDTQDSALWVPTRLRGADGEPLVVLATFSPVYEGEERPSRVLCVAQDVTQERRQELIREKTFQMARLVSEEGDLEPLAQKGLILLMAVIGSPHGALYLARTGDPLRALAQAGERAPTPAMEALARDALAAQAPRRTDDAVALPLVEHGEALGALVLAAPAGAHDGDDMDVLAALGSSLAVGLRRSLFEARLKEYAVELEARVAERTAELTQKTDEMEQFLYSVSHDLKAPLISIQGYSQGLEEDFGRVLEGDGALYLERIRKNASLMESLILDILELSRIGRIRERGERVDVGALIVGIRQRLADRFAATGGELVLEPDLPGVHGEARRLDQLFTNLLDNALKYRAPHRPPVVRVGATTTPEEVVYHVRDNGRGIPAEFHDQLFKIFQRVPQRGLDDPGGTGMGLAIVKRIVETHGGRVWIESAAGEGATFHVALPRRTRSQTLTPATPETTMDSTAEGATTVGVRQDAAP